MRLNGWQRLWVVVVGLWMVPVIVVAYSLWPTAASVPKGEVSISLDPNAGEPILTVAERKAVEESWLEGLPDGLSETQFEELQRIDKTPSPILS